MPVRVKYWYNSEHTLSCPRLRRCPTVYEVDYALRELKKDTYPVGSTHYIYKHYYNNNVTSVIYLLKELDNVYRVLDSDYDFQCTIDRNTMVNI